MLIVPVGALHSVSIFLFYFFLHILSGLFANIFLLYRKCGRFFPAGQVKDSLFRQKHHYATFSLFKVEPVPQMKTEIRNVTLLISSSFENKAIKVFVRHNHHYYFHAPNCFAASCLQLSQLSDLTNPLNQDANVLRQKTTAAEKCSQTPRRLGWHFKKIYVVVTLCHGPPDQKLGNKRKCEIFLCESPREPYRMQCGVLELSVVLFSNKPIPPVHNPPPTPPPTTAPLCPLLVLPYRSDDRKTGCQLPGNTHKQCPRSANYQQKSAIDRWGPCILICKRCHVLNKQTLMNHFPFGRAKC